MTPPMNEGMDCIHVCNFVHIVQDFMQNLYCGRNRILLYISKADIIMGDRAKALMA
jgi:hypothetical protein